MYKKIITLLFVLSWCFTLSAQDFMEVSPILKPVNHNPALEATWDVQFNYDAVVVTGAAGNAGAVYIPTINKFWTSRWGSAIAHQWNANGTLDVEFTLPFTGTRGMCFDGQYVYHSTNTTTVQIVDPVTRTVVGTVPVVGSPNGARYITYNPDGNSGAGSIIVGNWTSPNFNFYEFSMTGTLLRTITNTVTGVYGLAYDNWSAGGPFLWVWSQGAGAGTPQLIQQMDYTSGTYTGVTHDVVTDIAAGIAGGLFITDQLVPGYVTLGGMLQGNPDTDRLFGYELTTTGGGCNGIIFSDDFESGTGQWTLQGAWGLATNQSYSPTHSLSESPSGNYPANQNISATMTTGVDLSSALGAELKFWAKYDIEQGFDYMYLEVTTNGTNWVQLEAFNAEGVPWTEFTYDLSGFVGNSDVKIRFRFFSDGGYEVDGMYIDDFEISCSDADLSAPLIVHAGPEFYQGTPDPFDVISEITDISGIASAEVQYTVDGGSVQSVGPSNISGSTYTFTIPAQLAGSWVDYSIYATDNLNNSTVDPPVYKYISGTYVGYDNPEVSFYVPFAVGTGAAVRMTAPAGDNILVTALIRNYTDINNPNNDMLFHVWSNVGGLPGTDLITPFLVTPEATLQNTSAMTRIDLRPYLAQLSNLTGDFHVGFTVPSGIVNITEYSPAVANRSANYTTSWSLATADYHFRVIMGNPSNIPVELTSFAASVTNGGNVVLNWSTATETNNHMFEIERRASQAEYFTIGFVNGAGTTTEPQNYSYTDQTVENGVYFYRLKQLDFDGSYAYSDEVEVDVKGPLTFNLVQNYPNPFNPSTNINYSIPEAGNIRLSVYNIVGEEVAVLVDGFSQAGFFEVSFNASNLPSGVYMYKLQSANSVQTKKMMLLK